jgi:predicted nucleic acid-binding protein
MSNLLVDSSVIAKWILPEIDSPLAFQVFSDVHARGEECVALDLAIIEVANAIWVQFRRGATTIDGSLAYRNQLLRLVVQWVPANALVTRAFEVALQYRIAIYDALCVAAVNQLGLPGVTADERLHSAVQADFPTICLLRDWKASSP